MFCVRTLCSTQRVVVAIIIVVVVAIASTIKATASTSNTGAAVTTDIALFFLPLFVWHVLVSAAAAVQVGTINGVHGYTRINHPSFTVQARPLIIIIIIIIISGGGGVWALVWLQLLV
jgi:hypothetical protein